MKIHIKDKFLLLPKEGQEQFVQLIINSLESVLKGEEWIYDSNYTEDYKPYVEVEEYVYLPRTYLAYVLDVAKVYGFEVTILGTHEVPNVALVMPNYPFELYGYQKEIINTVLNSKYENSTTVRNNGFVDFATNAGKTEVIAALANSYRAYYRGTVGKVIIVSYDGQGAVQTAKRLRDYNVPLSRVIRIETTSWLVNNSDDVDKERVDISSIHVAEDIGGIIIMTIDQIKTWAAREKAGVTTGFSLGCILWDEPDKITLNTLKAVIELQKANNYFQYIYGFTGTYDRTKKIRQLITSQVVGTAFSENIEYPRLKEMGQSAKVVVKLRKLKPLSLTTNLYFDTYLELVSLKADIMSRYKKSNLVPSSEVTAYKKIIGKLLYGCPWLQKTTKKKLYLNYYRRLTQLDAYNFERDFLAFNEPFINTVLKPILEEYKVSYNKDNSIGLLVNCTNSVDAIDLLTKCIEDLLNDTNVVVSPGHGEVYGKSLSEIKDDFQNKKINILVTAAVKHGLSHNNLHGLINFWGKPTDKLAQLAGRVERNNSRECNFIYELDFSNFKLPISIKHSEGRKAMYQEIGYDVMLTD